MAAEYLKPLHNPHVFYVNESYSVSDTCIGGLIIDLRRVCWTCGASHTGCMPPRRRKRLLGRGYGISAPSAGFTVYSGAGRHPMRAVFKTA
jgi:hypothetical protein